MRVRGRSLFPVGLYASLLVALLALLRPTAVAPIERVAHAAVALPFRAYGGLHPRPAQAAAAIERRSVRSVEAVDAFWRDLVRREQQRRPAQIPATHEAMHCRVVDRSLRGGRLVLDRTWSEVEACAEWVTVGDHLVGFLAPRGAPDADVEVQLLGAWQPGADVPVRRVPANIETVEGSGEWLHFLVEPAASIDPWSMRCTLLDDPYRAARLQRDGQMVLTADYPDDPLGPLPAGLRLGILRVWGYEREGAVPVPIGFFVEALGAEGLPLVTLWADRAGAAAHADNARPLQAGPWLDSVPVEAFELAGGRWFASLPVADTASLRRGAPLLRGLRQVGAVRSAGPGYAIVEPFGAVGAVWDVVCMPSEAGEAGAVPRKLSLRVVDANDSLVVLRVEGGRALPAARCRLFTSSVDGPAGLWLGDAVAKRDDARVLAVQRPAPAQAGGLRVVVPGRAGAGSGGRPR